MWAPRTEVVFLVTIVENPKTGINMASFVTRYLSRYGFFSTQKLYTSSILRYIYAILFLGSW
jgi:hypothetical protein